MTIEESLPKDLIVKVITNNLNYVATQLQKFYQIMDHGCKGNAGKKDTIPLCMDTCIMAV